ncbi:hypothetical protein STVA_41560 [Allostella vacuolata]|nr:hypothetical protein STVA_41560 [Stella vacuolata]
MQQAPLVGVRAAAAALGLAPSTVSRQLAAGIIPNRGSSAEPLVDVEEARAARADRLDHGKAKGTRTGELDIRPPAPRRETTAGKRDQKLDQEIRRLERENAEREKELLSRAATDRAFAELAGIVQRGLAERSRRLGARVTGRRDLAEVMTAIEDEDRKILEAMRDEYRRQLA